VAQNGRPNKRVYRLTDAGQLELSGWVADSTPQPRLKDDFFITPPWHAPIPQSTQEELAAKLLGDDMSDC